MLTNAILLSTICFFIVSFSSICMCFYALVFVIISVQVFLEPLSKVLGQAKSKTLLLDAARSNTRYLNKLHQMGLLLGITEWRGDFNSKLVSPVRPEAPSPVKKV